MENAIDETLLDAQLEQFIKDNLSRLTEDVIRLIAIPSIKSEATEAHPYGDEVARALDLALSMAEDAGFETENRSYYYGGCTLPGTEHIGSLAMAAHLDVVPAPADGWSRPPFEGYVRDGYIVGRGSTDNKGSAVAALLIMRFFKEHSVPLRHDLRLVFGCDEECGSSDMKYLVQHDPKVPDFVLVPDGPFPVCHAEKGRFELRASFPLKGELISLEAGEASNSTPGTARAVLRSEKNPGELSLGERLCAGRNEAGELILTAAGVSQHTGNPAGAVDALQLLTEALLDNTLVTGSDETLIRGLRVLSADHFGQGFGIAIDEGPLGKVTNSCSLVRTEGSTVRLTADLRYPANQCFESLWQRVESTMLGLGFTVDGVSNDPPNYFPADSELMVKLSEISNSRTGSRLGPAAMSGGTYARKFPHAVAYGPSRPDIKKPFPDGHGWAHQIDEAVRIENLTDMIFIYVKALLMLDKLL